jgi:hypothetical protein
MSLADCTRITRWVNWLFNKHLPNVILICPINSPHSVCFAFGSLNTFRFSKLETQWLHLGRSTWKYTTHIPIYQGSLSASFYHSGTLFVDHASHIYTLLHRSLQKQKRLYKPKTIDNDVYKSKLFCKKCSTNNQAVTSCGVDAHHQMGLQSVT